jgi:hypothetical protein
MIIERISNNSDNLNTQDNIKLSEESGLKQYITLSQDEFSKKYGNNAYFEKSKEVLNVLEKEQGINIYDENNYGGMYLLKNEAKVSPKIKNFFQKNKNPKTIEKTIYISPEIEQKVNDLEKMRKLFGKK